MRGADKRQRALLVVFDAEQRVPKGHPLRRIKALADAALAQLSPRFDEMYSAVGRPSIPPERLLKASLLMALHTIRSERMFCEQLGYNFLFRWFLDLEADEASFDHSTFSRNRARLLEHAVADEFFRAVVAQARGLNLLSDEHFTVDGTLVEAWASLKSFKRKDAGLCYSANALMENRHALLVDFQVEPADGYAERRAALAMIDGTLPGSRRITLAGDKGYDTRDFVANCRTLGVTPHVAQNEARPGGSALDPRTVRHPGYAISQSIRKQVEEAFGWMKTIGGLRKTRYRGRERVQMHAYLVAAAYNLIRIAKLCPAPA